MRMPRIKACTTPESTKPQPLLSFFFSLVDSSRSSNIVLPSYRKGPGHSLSRPAAAGPPLSLGLPEFSTGCGSGCNNRRALASPLVPGHHQGRGNTETGIRSYQNSNHQSKGKSAQDLATHQEQHHDSQKRQAAGQDGARKSLVNGTIHDGLEWFAAHKPRVLTDPVKDHNRVVHRISDQGK